MSFYFHEHRAYRGRKQTQSHSTVLTAWQGMGTRSFCRTALPPIQIFPVLVVITTIWGSVNTCQVDECWNRYSIALEALESHNPLYAKCVALRTYSYCIRNMTRGCFGNIKFHSIQKVVENQMNHYNCTVKGQIFNGTRPPPTRPQEPNIICSYKGKPTHRHCGLFGDPHLRTFDNDFQTCKVKGAWPLIENEHLTIQVTNDPVGDGNGQDGATATSKLTVVVKENEECAAHKFLTYQAQSNDLPSTFDDGRTHAGPDRSVQITEVEPGKHVELYLRYIDTTILVRQVGGYFTFAIRMPEDIVNTSRDDPYGIQLCVKGCPRSERIDYKEFISQKHGRLKVGRTNSKTPAMTIEQAEKKCREAQVVDFYLDSCVFDLMTTGDTNFTEAANIALRDVVRLNPEAVKMHANRTSLDIYRFANSARTTQFSHRTLYSLLALYTVLILVNR